jgi:hypothetical protein
MRLVTKLFSAVGDVGTCVGWGKSRMPSFTAPSSSGTGSPLASTMTLLSGAEEEGTVTTASA